MAVVLYAFAHVNAGTEPHVMPDYAVEIGQIILRSSKPITEEQRKLALQELRERNRVVYVTIEGLEVIIRPR